jgi:hypothetical protein
MPIMAIKATLRKSCIIRLALRRARPALTELSVASGLKKEEVPWEVREMITKVRQMGRVLRYIGRMGTSERWVARRRGRKRYKGAVIMGLEEGRLASGQTNEKIGNLHRAVKEPLNCCKSDIAGGIVGRVFAADEASSKDEARAGKEPCVGPRFVFTAVEPR